MIISIRGTSGSGKSHLVRRVKEWWGDDWEIEIENGKIAGYTSRSLFIFGTYREGLQSGGADVTKWGAFRTREYRMGYLADWARKGYHVMFEGLMESGEVHRTVKWGAICPVHVIFLDTSLGDCLAYIGERRARRGITEPVNPYQTERKYRELQNVQKRLVAAGVDAQWLDRDAAFLRVQQLLKGGGSDDRL